LPGHWLLDPERSSVAFQHKGMWGLVTVKGTFARVSGEGEVLPDGTGRGTVVIDAGSLDTKNAKRDTHLRSADFFVVDQHPEIRYAARGATRAADGGVAVTGELTVRGTTQPVSFTARATELAADAITLTGELAVDRTRFGMTWNQLGGLRGPATIALTIRFTRRNA
jgi:polyisoprenoid-binding protein YceI